MNGKKYFFSGIAVGAALLLALYLLAITARPYIKPFINSFIQRPLEVDEKINEIMEILDNHYINEYRTDLMVESMFRGMVAGVGDPYTYYFDPESFAEFMQQSEGVYAGIGVVVAVDEADNLVTVVTPYEGSPGKLAGLQAGDKFIMIDGNDVSDKKLEDVTSMTKGPPGTHVTITVYRPSENRTFELEIIRDTIKIPTVAHRMLDHNVGYIRIVSFERVTLEQFQNALEELNGSGMEGLIIDLRNNPGGLLDVVVKITDELIPEGVIVYTEDKNGKREYFNAGKNHLGIPLTILVNGNSASASEVLSGAVKDHNVAELVGMTTFGKGIVQNIFRLSDGSAVKVTISKYFTPNGVCIQSEGIEPDYIVEMDETMSLRIGELTFEEDVQLQKALEVTLNKIK